jgi:hypothetical protein
LIERLLRAARNWNSYTLPSTLRVIERKAFSNTALKAVVIPKGITSLSGFDDCTSLASVTIPNSVKTIGFSRNTDGDDAFSGCTSLTTVTISPVKREWRGRGESL